MATDEREWKLTPIAGAAMVSHRREDGAEIVGGGQGLTETTTVVPKARAVAAEQTVADQEVECGELQGECRSLRRRVEAAERMNDILEGERDKAEAAEAGAAEERTHAQEDRQREHEARLAAEQRVRELERALEVEGDVWTCMTCGVIGDRQSCGACGAESRPGRWVREAKLATAVEALRPLEHKLADCRAAHAERSRTLLPDSISPQVALQHYLAEIICDHVGKRDHPRCSCSRVDLGWHPTVGEAVQAWIDHAVAETRALTEIGEGDAAG